MDHISKADERRAIFRRVKELEEMVNKNLLKIMDRTGDVLTDKEENSFRSRYLKIQNLTVWAACRFKRDKKEIN